MTLAGSQHTHPTNHSAAIPVCAAVYINILTKRHSIKFMQVCIINSVLFLDHINNTPVLTAIMITRLTQLHPFPVWFQV